MNGEARVRRAVSWKAVTVGFWALLALAFALAVVIYFALIRYERVAAQHLPRGTRAALRLDVEKAVLYEPARKHLVPLANEFVGPRSRFDLRTRLERLHSKSGVELAVDLREVVLGIGPSLSDWVVVLGGRFPRSGVIAGLDQVLREEGYYFKRGDGGQVLSLPGGVSIAQAADGSLVLASSADQLSRALDAQDTYLEIGLSPRGVGAFAAQSAFFATLSDSRAGALAARVPDLRSLERLTGTLELGPEVQIRAAVELESTQDPTSAVERVERLLRALRGLSGTPQQDLAGEQRLLDRAEVRADGPGRVTIRTLWARPDIDRAANTLATVLRAAVPARPGASAP